jgi:hypothetical protein
MPRHCGAKGLCQELISLRVYTHGRLLLGEKGCEEGTSPWGLLALRALVRLRFLLGCRVMLSLRDKLVIQVRARKSVATHEHAHACTHSRRSWIIWWITFVSRWGFPGRASILSLSYQRLNIKLILRSSNLLRLFYGILMLICYDDTASFDLSDIFLVSLTPRGYTFRPIRRGINVVNDG